MPWVAGLVIVGSEIFFGVRMYVVGFVQVWMYVRSIERVDDDSCSSKGGNLTSACLLACCSLICDWGFCCRVVQGREGGWIRSSVISNSLVPCFCFFVWVCTGTCTLVLDPFLLQAIHGPWKLLLPPQRFRVPQTPPIAMSPHIPMYDGLASKHFSFTQ